MTFECEVVLRILWVDVVDGNSAFDAAQSKPRWCICLLVSKDAHTPMLKTYITSNKFSKFHTTPEEWNLEEANIVL